MARIPILSHGSQSLQTDQFRVWGGPDFIRLQTGAWETTLGDRADDWPVVQGVMRKARTANLMIEILPRTRDEHEAALAFVRSLFSPKRNRTAQLMTVTIEGVNYTGMAVMRAMLPHESGVTTRIVTGQVEILDQTWHTETASEVEATEISASPGTVAVTNVGNVDSHRWQLALTPTAQKAAADGMLSRRFCNLAPMQPRDSTNHPIEITGGGLDTAALILAGEMHGSGHDVTVLVDGIPVPRYFGAGTAGIDQATTKIWIARDLPAKRAWTLIEAIGTGADIDVRIQEEIGHMPAAPFRAKLPATGEVVWITGYDRRNRTLTIGGRGARGTAASVASIGDEIVYMPFTIDLVYGHTGAADPAWSDAFRPIPADSEDSGNDEWTFAVYQETVIAADVTDRLPRPGSWRTASRPFPDWTEDEEVWKEWIPWTGGLGVDANPATSIAIGYNAAGATAGHPLTERWEISSGIAMDRFVFTDTCNLTHPGAPNEGRLEARMVGIDGHEARLGAWDTDVAVLRTLTPSAPALYWALCVKPWDPANIEDNPTQSDNLVGQQPTDNFGWSIAAGATIRFLASEALSVDLSAAEDIYQFGTHGAPARISNENGESVYIDGVVVAIGDTLTIDSEDMTAEISEGTSVANLVRGIGDLCIPGPPDESPASRPYTSDLTYIEDGIGTVELALPEYRSAWF